MIGGNHQVGRATSRWNSEVSWAISELKAGQKSSVQDAVIRALMNRFFSRTRDNFAFL